MKLLSVNVSLPRETEYKGKIVKTGIFKEPVEGRVKVNTLNIEGDGQADLLSHGGIYRAVYVYSYDNYAYWEKELNRKDFTIGQFGENFTVEGMLDDEIHATTSTAKHPVARHWTAPRTLRFTSSGTTPWSSRLPGP